MHNFIFLYYGLLAMLTQLVIFRELSVLFYGSELFLGTFLSSWLFWLGLGSLSVRQLLRKGYCLEKYFSYSFLALSIFFPGVILAIRLSKGIFAFGEFIGPVGTILFTFAIMSFLCFVTGAQFSLACAVAESKIKKGSALGQVYFCEALGAVIGGVLFTYVLIGSVPLFVIALILSLICIFISWALSFKKIPLRSTLSIVAALVILLVNFKIEPAVNRMEWRKYQFVKQKETRNATLSLVKMGSIKNVFADGILSASFPGPESYEPVGHWPLLAIAKPANILVIGDFSLGVLKEALKHNPESVDYVMPDESFLDFVRPHLDAEDISALNDARIKLDYGDPRLFVKNKKDKYDAVIINIQEVPNLKINRFYTREFYVQIKSRLKSTGILALSVASSENYLSMQTRLFNASVYRTLKSVFETIEVIPGDNIVFLSSLSSIDMRKDTILERFTGRGISNHYVIPSYIGYKLEIKRRAELKKILEETPGVEINRDFRPTTYYYFVNFWLNKFTSPLEYIIAGILFFVIIFIVFKKREAVTLLIRRKECLIVFVLGFMGILLELILLFSFQIISGYVYWQMGVLFASFMLGLFLGAALGIQFKDSLRQKYFIMLVILFLTIIGLSVWMGRILPCLVNLSTIQNIVIFVSFLVLTGIVVGAAFVIAGFLISANQVISKAGSLYAADLWGAALGAALTTNFIVPVFGLLGALNFSAITGLAGLTIFLILPKNAG